MKMRKFKKGFTLVELVVVIAVIAILAAVSVGAYFGVTDSANSSAAEQYKKQIKDIWTMFSVSSDYKIGNTDDVIRENAEYFCMNYVRELGPAKVFTTYKLIDINPVKDVEGKKDSTYTSTAVMFLLKSDYSTYIVVHNDVIFAESDLIKSEENFKSLMDTESTEYISPDDRAYFKQFGYEAFELSQFTVNGEETVGYLHYEIAIDSNNDTEDKVIPIRTTQTFVDGTQLSNQDVQAIGSSGSNVSVMGKPYVLTHDGEEFDTSACVSLDNLTEKYTEPKSIDESNKNYSLGIYNVIKTNNYQQGLNLVNYPVLHAQYNKQKTQFTYFTNMDDAKDTIEAMKDSSDTGYIFIGKDAVLTKEVNVPSNTKVVLDCHTNINQDNTSSFTSFINDDKSNGILWSSFSSYNGWSQNPNSNYKKANASDAEALNNLYNYDTISSKNEIRLIISGDGHLKVNNNIHVTADVHFPEGGASGLITKNACTILLKDKNSQITLGENSNLYAYGIIEGDGTVNTSNKTNVFDLLKVSVFHGGTLTTAIIGDKWLKFPFFDYQMDNIRAKTKFVKGSNYKAIAGFTASITFAEAAVGFFGESNSLFKPYDENSSVVKSYDVNRHTSVFEINGKISDTQLNIEVSGSKVSTTKISLPVCNMEIKINPNAILDLSVSSAKYEILPNSKIINHGTLNIGESTTLVLVNANEYIYNNKPLNNANGYDNGDAKKWMPGLVSIYENCIRENKLLYNFGNVIGKIYANRSQDNFDFEFSNETINVKGWNINEGSDVYNFRLFYNYVYKSILFGLSKEVTQIDFINYSCYPITFNQN